jgi:D-serine deaminase-like pyridoxal phosphate-dependent protein
MNSPIGLRLSDLDTPVLLLDRAAMQRNLQKLAGYFAGRSAQLRPHFKNHKCTQLAKAQLAAGSAVGITCAKLGEAEVLVEAGITNILIANQVVGPIKLERLTRLAKQAQIRVAVDNPAQIEAIGKAAVCGEATVGLLVEVDIGMGRCGVQPGEPALALARQIAATKGVRFDGLQAYEGNLVDVKDRSQREQRVREAFAPAVQTRRLIERAGLAPCIISGGSSSTYQATGSIEGIDEIQAGTYATMDWFYHDMAGEFEIAMSVLARVISRPSADRAVLDVGLKGLGHEFGPPKIKGLLDSSLECRLSEEHCTVPHPPDWQIGDLVEVIPSHACTTCNLYRRIHVHDGGRMVEVWPIEGSGRLE